MRFGRLAPVAVLAAWVGVSSAMAAGDLFDEIYARGKPIEANLKTLTARFTETSTSSLLAKPLVSKGTLAVLRPNKVILRYEAPERRTVLIDGDVLRVLWPSRGLDQKTGIGAAQRRINQYFVAKSPAQLRSHFEIAATTPAARPGTWHVVMTPKRRQIREGLSRLELWLDQQSVVLTAMEMTFATGDTKLMEFTDVALNPALDPAVFTP